MPSPLIPTSSPKPQTSNPVEALDTNRLGVNYDKPSTLNPQPSTLNPQPGAGPTVDKNRSGSWRGWCLSSKQHSPSRGS